MKENMFPNLKNCIKTKLKIAALEQKLRLSQIELEEPKPSIKQKRGEYEKEYITRYSKQQKAKPKKKSICYTLVFEANNLEKRKNNL